MEGKYQAPIENTCNMGPRLQAHKYDRLQSQSLLARLKERRSYYVEALARIDAAITYMEYNPGAESFVSTLSEQGLI